MRNESVARRRLSEARGATFECLAILKSLRARGVLDGRQYGGVRAQLIETARQLGGLLKSIDALR